jgi:hypothetical protein
MLAAGVALYVGYEWYKFPPGSTDKHAELLKAYVPTWSGNPILALVALLISPAAGVFFYNPPLLLCILGMISWNHSERLFCVALCASLFVFILFICSLTYFKGDTAWGPRYLTPVFAVFWIMAPLGFSLVHRRMAVSLLAAGFLVQLCSLATSPYRLYRECGLPSWFYVSAPELYFHPAISHLVNRPREIAEILSSGETRPIYYDPPYRPRFPSYRFLDSQGRLYQEGVHAVGESGVLASKRPWWATQNFKIIDALRPWWASLRRLGPREQPIEIGRTVVLLVLVATTGLLLMILCTQGARMRNEGNRELGPDS